MPHRVRYRDTPLSVGSSLCYSSSPCHPLEQLPHLTGCRPCSVTWGTGEKMCFFFSFFPSSLSSSLPFHSLHSLFSLRPLSLTYPSITLLSFLPSLVSSLSLSPLPPSPSLSLPLPSVSHSVGSVSPALGHILLLKLNPISLLALGQCMSVLTAKLFIDFESVF